MASALAISTTCRQRALASAVLFSSASVPEVYGLSCASRRHCLAGEIDAADTSRAAVATVLGLSGSGIRVVDECRHRARVGYSVV